MLPVLIFLIALLVAALVAVILIDWLTGPPLKREVVIHTRKPDDQTVRGILTQRSNRWLKLEAVTYLDEQEKIPLNGDVRIRADNVSFIQVL